MHHFFQTGAVDGELLPEDYYFCELALRAGHPTFVDTAIHMGGVEDRCIEVRASDPTDHAELIFSWSEGMNVSTRVCPSYSSCCSSEASRRQRAHWLKATVVNGTGNPNVDIRAVQAAVNLGGNVVLRGHFSFNNPPTISTSLQTVGFPLATILISKAVSISRCTS